MTDNPYLTFVEEIWDNRKTRVIRVESRSSGIALGRIKWFGRWRQYCYFPGSETVYNVGCLASINEQIETLMAERKRSDADA